MKKLNKVNVKRNDTVAAFACRYECAEAWKIKYACDSRGAQIEGYSYSTNRVYNYRYHK